VLKDMAGNVLGPQWTLLNGSKHTRDGRLFDRREGLVLGTVSSSGFMSNTLYFGEIKPAPPTPVMAFYDNKGVPMAILGESTSGFLKFGPQEPFTFHNRRINPAQFTEVKDNPPFWTIGYCQVSEGSPAQRFAIGLTLGLESMHKAIQDEPLELVGEIHLEVMQFQQTLQLSLWSPALRKPMTEAERFPAAQGCIWSSPMPPQGVVE
jgi:hypothetical protein